MIFVTKFRANDLNPSKGRQIEFNTNVARDFFGFTKPSYNVIFDCCSVLCPSSVKRVKVALSLSPARGDYKIYQNADSSIDLKDYFLDELKLTTAANLDDYYAIKKITDDKYLLTYIPKGAEFEKFYKNASESLYFIDETEDKESTEDEVVEIIHKDYLNLLRKNYNLVLTGAPGTGKTFLAKQIAATMVGNCMWKNLSDEQKTHIRFVQFHPSYDYTDFVEGLRPDKNGNFVRTDGDFKEFCKLAIQGNVRTNISSTSFESVYQSLIDDVKNGRITDYTRRSGDKRQVSVSSDGRLMFQFANGEMRSESVKNLKLFYEYFIEHPDISPESFNKEQYGELIEKLTSESGKVTRSVDYGEYSWVLQQLLDRTNSLNEITSSQETLVGNNDSPYVFIIDEINRGEISKIFGELFYSIEKDYRGDETLVRTQYNNMVKSGDVFFKGFYVPKNVYIIGTMNDIDRGVEAMDFAIRRRFAWKEVTAEESAVNMGITGKALLKMNALNRALLDANLNEAFFIGGAYFRHVENEDFANLWNYHLKGIVFEYFRGDPDANDKIAAIEKAYSDAGEIEPRTESDATTVDNAAE
jgi:5-methylcytosine-specific restriction endonuclease McrBC GTP-binding regulatory subunit McrB